MSNFLDLSDRQMQVLEALARTGCCTDVCNELGIALPTVSILLRRACVRAGVKNKVLLVLKWAEWKRERALEDRKA